MSDNLIKFKHVVKTPLSTISVAIDSVKPFVHDLILQKKKPDFYINIRHIVTGKELETILKLLHNVELAAEQINNAISILEEN